MPKNIVVFSDGTGQEGGKRHNTNVYKLFNMIEDRTAEQVAFYDRGLGTGWRKFTGLAFGAGISRNIKECYKFIFENYQSRDRLYLFGFSRGAFTVRSLSGLLHLFGILPKSRPELIDQAYKIYKISDKDKRKQQADDFLNRHHSMRCPIRFLGVWDTVGALGVPNKALDILNPFPHKFHDTGMCNNVEAGRHALAIDDERKVFKPIFWDESQLTKTPDGIAQEIKQVWFAGMHSDVGGGYKEQQLSDLALDWMLAEAKSFGLRIYGNHKVKLDPDPHGKMHDSRRKFPSTLYRKKIREIDHKKVLTPLVHESVFDRATKTANNYHPWILNLEPKPETEPYHNS